MHGSLCALAILIVEDERSIRFGFERWLKGEGAVVEGTGTGAVPDPLLKS